MLRMVHLIRAALLTVAALHPALDDGWEARSLSRMASSAALAPLFQKLYSGRPVTVGMLGASVGQYGGCLRDSSDPSAEEARCSGYPDGYMVRMLRAINRTWPNPGHKLQNGAASATPPQNLLTCLFSFISPSNSIVVLEFGSMAPFLELCAQQS